MAAARSFRTSTRARARDASSEAAPMTIMNWRLEPGRALILSDTLVTDGKTGAPGYVGPKVLVLPHLLAILSAKGLYRPAVDLWSELMGPAGGGANIAGVVALAPALLQRSHLMARAAAGEAECTVLLFGWCWERRRVVGYAFPQESGFRPVQLADTEALIPPPATPLPGSADWGATIYAQQAADRLLEPSERDNIGGYLLAHHVVARPAGGAQILVEQLGPLPMSAGDWAALPAPDPILEPEPCASPEWARCEAWLVEALAYGDGAQTVADLRDGYASGRYVLFPGRKSAALVEVVDIAGANHLHFYLAGGELPEIRDELRPQLESFGQRLGCVSIFCNGRPGWARAFRAAGYRREDHEPSGRWVVVKALATSAAARFAAA